LSYSINDVKDKLISLDDVRETLSYTEPLVVHDFDADSISFRLEDDYNHGLKALDSNDTVNAYISVGGRELQLTKAGLYDALKQTKVSKGFLDKAPAHLAGELLNTYYREGLTSDRELKGLGIRGDKVAAIARAAVHPYSNLRFLDLMLDAIEQKYGKGEVFADYKFTHNLQQTHLRLIVPEYVRVIENTGTDNDTWSTGLQLINSLTGAEQTEINGYLFRYWCTNGAIDTRTNANSTWSRRGAAGRDDEAVFEWARDAVDEVLGGLEESLDAVQAMTSVSIEGHTRETLNDVFREYGIPSGQRSQIISGMLDDRELTMYSLMQAVTQLANGPDLSPVDVDRLMRIGGELPAAAEQGVCSQDNPCGRLLAHAH
jgi:hypothetical protein